MRNQKKNLASQQGFTLIEMLIVVAIVGLLSATIMVGLAQSRAKARDTKRKEDLSQMSKAVELYYTSKSIGYPNTSGSWWGVTSCGGTHGVSGATGYIPNLAPEFVGYLPTDPRPSAETCSGYAYRSDGINYKIISNSVNGTGGPETFPTDPADPFYDPASPTTRIKITNNSGVTDSWN